MTELEHKVYDVVRKIPAGWVMTYGDVAQCIGGKKYARFVGNVMHKNPRPFWKLAQSVGFAMNGDSGADAVVAAVVVDENAELIVDGRNFVQVPCHRVVDSKGKMGSMFGLGGPAVQALMLKAEGVRVVEGKVELAKYRFGLGGEENDYGN